MLCFCCFFHNKQVTSFYESAVELLVPRPHRPGNEATLCLAGFANRKTGQDAINRAVIPFRTIMIIYIYVLNR